MDNPDPEVKTPSRRASRSAPVEAFRLAIMLWASVPAIQPLLRKGLPGGTYDVPYHLYRLLDFDRTFRASQSLPWIAPHLALDYGYATFTFYAPLGLYLGEVFHLLGLGYIASLKACFAAAILASVFGTYLLARDLFDWRAAMPAAVLYAYVPYRLLDMYVGGDLAEVVAQAALPFVFWGFWRVMQRPGSGSAAVAGAALAALILAHTITALFAAPLILGFLVAWLLPRRSRRQLSWVVIAGAIGLALSGVYWLPTLAQLKEINSIALTSGQFDVRRELLPLGQLVQPRLVYDYRLLPEIGSRYNLGLVQVALAALAILWVVLTRPPRTGFLIGSALAACLLVWMQQRGSEFVWNALPLAQYIQYPNRLYSYVGLISALLLGSFAARPRLAKPGIPGCLVGRRFLTGIGLGLECAVVLLFVGTSLGHLPRHQASLQESEVNLPTVWRRENDLHLIAGNTQGDFLPAAAGSILSPEPSIASDRTPTSSSVRLTALWSGPLSLDARFTAARPSSISFDRLDYPGWTVTIDGKPTAISGVPPLDSMRISVPPGQHDLRLSDPGTLVDRVGAGISLGALLILAIIIIAPRRRGWPRRLGLIVAVAVLVTLGLASQMRPPRQLAGGVDFGDAVRLVGGRVDRVPGSQPGAVDVTLIWEALRSPLPACSVHLALQDPSGRVVAGRDKAPLFGLRPCTQWRAGEIVRDHQQIRLPPGAAAGPYRLAVGLSLGGKRAMPVADDPSSQRILPASGGTDDGARLMSLGLVNAPAPPRPVMLRGSFPVGATIGGIFSLDAARIEVISPSGEIGPTRDDQPFIARIAPGDGLRVDLRWRSIADAPADYAVFVHLVDARHQRVAQRDSFPDHENFPTTVWFPGDTLVDEYRLDTRPSLRPGVYALTVGMYTRHDLKTLPVRGNRSRDHQAILGQVKVSRRDQIFGHRESVVPLGAVFGDQITLVGAAVRAPSPASHEPIAVDLKWRADRQPTADYTVFVHVLDWRGRLVSQHDGQPLDGTYPTADWDGGDIIFERILVPVPPSLPTGTYRVEAGLYQLATGTRLRLADGATAVRIGTISR